MSERPWWSHTLQWGLWVLMMSLVMGWLAKARRPAERAAGADVLSHPRTTLILGAVCTGFFVLAAVLSGIQGKAEEWWVPYAFCLFALLGALMIAEGLWVRHELRLEGITYRGLLRRYSIVRWEEIEAAHWSSSMKWLVLKTRDGRALRFSAMLNGLRSLAIALEGRVSDLDVDDATAKVLADARQGILPSVWR